MLVVFTITEINYLVVGLFYDLVGPFLYFVGSITFFVYGMATKATMPFPKSFTIF